MDFEQECYDLFGDLYGADFPAQVQKTLAAEPPAAEAQAPCPHAERAVVGGQTMCSACGLEIEWLDFEPEWQSSLNGRPDASRCHKPRASKGGVFKMFEDYCVGESEAVVKETAKRYARLVEGQTRRAKNRRGLVAACYYHVLDEGGDPRTANDVAVLFDLDSAKMAEGNKVYELQARNRAKASQTQTQTVCHVIGKLAQEAGIPSSHVPQIKDLARALENTSYMLNHSQPASVAAAVIFFFLYMQSVCAADRQPRDPGAQGSTAGSATGGGAANKRPRRRRIKKKEFARLVDLSDITIGRLVKEIWGLLSAEA